jgi:hypothetical protein
MPSAIVHVCHRYSRDEEVRLMESVHASIVQAFKVDPVFRNVTLMVHEPHRFVGRLDCPDPGRLTHIDIYVLPGRTVAAKRMLYRQLVDRLEPFGIPPACVLVRLHELPGENLGVRGGQAACDVEIGYPLDV